MTELNLRGYRECSALTGLGLKDVFDEAVVVGLSEEEEVSKKCFCLII